MISLPSYEKLFVSTTIRRHSLTTLITSRIVAFDRLVSQSRTACGLASFAWNELLKTVCQCLSQKRLHRLSSLIADRSWQYCKSFSLPANFHNLWTRPIRSLSLNINDALRQLVQAVSPG